MKFLEVFKIAEKIGFRFGYRDDEIEMVAVSAFELQNDVDVIEYIKHHLSPPSSIRFAA